MLLWILKPVYLRPKRLYRDMVGLLSNAKSHKEVVIAPPSIFLLLAREHLRRKGIEVAAQNVFDKPNGAFTGEISAEQLKDSGISWTLAGHSERRVVLREDDAVSFLLPERAGRRI